MTEYMVLTLKYCDETGKLLPNPQLFDEDGLPCGSDLTDAENLLADQGWKLVEPKSLLFERKTNG